MTRPSTAQKLAALKNGVELPVDPRVLHEPGTFLATDERAVLILSRVYARAEDADYCVISWACQVRAAEFFNAHGLSATLDEILRVGGPDALD